MRCEDITSMKIYVSNKGHKNASFWLPVSLMTLIATLDTLLDTNLSDKL